MATPFEIFAADAALILEEIGRPIRFRGTEVKAILADPAFSEALMAGGFSQVGSRIGVKVLRAPYEASLPATGELVGYPLDGSGNPTRHWVVESIETRPLSAWVRMDLKPWEA